MPIAAVKTPNPVGGSPLVKQSQRFISHAFFGTILKQMHESPWRSGMFSGGQAGRSFESLMDDRLAERMANNPTSQKLVRSIVKRLEKKGKEPQGHSERTREESGPGLRGQMFREYAQHDGARSVGSLQPARISGRGPADPVDGVLSNAAKHLSFLSQTPRIDLKG